MGLEEDPTSTMQSILQNGLEIRIANMLYNDIYSLCGEGNVLWSTKREQGWLADALVTGKVVTRVTPTLGAGLLFCSIGFYLTAATTC